MTSIIIVVLVLISEASVLSKNLVERQGNNQSSKMIVNTATVIRDGLEQELPITSWL